MSTATSPIDGPYAWFRLAVTVLLGTIGSIGMWVAVVVLPAAQADFGVDRAGASLPYAATMVGFGLGNIIIGRFADRLGITWPVIIAALGLGAGFGLAAQVEAIWQLTVLQGALIGVGTGAGFGPLIADLSHWFRKRRGLAVAFAASGNYLAGVVWPTLIQGIVATDGWRTAYEYIAILCVATMIPLALLLRRKLPPALGADGRPAPPEPLRQTPFSPRALQWLLALAGIGCCVAMSMPQVHIVSYCVDLGYGATVGAEMVALMSAGGVASRLFSGFLADYIGGIRTLLMGSVLQCAALFFFLPFDGLMSLYAISALFGLSQGGIVPSYAIVVREYMPAREAGSRIGIIVAATIFGMALGGWMSGEIYDLTGSYQLAFVNGIAWNVMNMAIVLSILWRTREPRAPRPALA
ncbi:MAG: MFS transporter [Alphaproteobacteria bacterium]|nr:MFS transporter [Alphaproteobacteria bacterium]MCB9930516.1 MFS transporter [Alphaproteobacteria bacterium]